MMIDNDKRFRCPLVAVWSKELRPGSCSVLVNNLTSQNFEKLKRLFSHFRFTVSTFVAVKSSLTRITVNMCS